MSLFVVVVTLACSVVNVYGHQCADGSRVQCTEVQSSSFSGIPSSTHGMGANGLPMCTDAGAKLYCLANHDYHNCLTGQAACCQDGSSPMHDGHSQGVHDSVTCSAKEIVSSGSSAADTSASSDGDPATTTQVILDDMDHAVAPAGEQTNTYEGSFEPCMRDAFNGQFHHDWANNKGSAKFSYIFDPPENGCYTLDEYHPGQATSCSTYMPSNAILDVEYCKGLSTRLSVNQAQNPAQWNRIGSFMFYAGTQGKLTMRNSDSEQCGAGPGGCFFMADAFRFTRFADKCPTADAASAMTMDSHHATLTGKTGTLILGVESTDGDVEATLTRQRDVVELTLAMHFGHATVTVTDIEAIARRLAEARALEASNFEVQFVASGQATGRPGIDDLAQALNTALSSHGLQVVSASVTWTEPAGSKTESTDGSATCMVFYIGVAAAAVLLLTCLTTSIVCVCRRRRAVAKASKDEQADAGKVDAENPVVLGDELKKDADAGEKGDMEKSPSETGSCSTNMPGSDDEKSNCSREKSDSDGALSPKQTEGREITEIPPTAPTFTAFAPGTDIDV